MKKKKKNGGFKKRNKKAEHKKKQRAIDDLDEILADKPRTPEREVGLENLEDETELLAKRMKFEKAVDRAEKRMKFNMGE